MSGSGHSPRHGQAVPMPIAEEGPDHELRRRMSKLSNSDIEQVANAALGEVTRRNSNRYGIIFISVMVIGKALGCVKITRCFCLVVGCKLTQPLELRFAGKPG